MNRSIPTIALYLFCGLIAPLQAKTEEVAYPYSPPDAALSDKIVPTYNQNARIAIDGSSDFFGDVSFLYWNVGQANLDIGRTALFSAMGLGSTPSPDASIPMQPFEYQPGFKIGLGFGTTFDNWQLNAEYTYLHHTNHFSTGTSATTFVENDPIIIPNDWFMNMLENSQRAQASRMSSDWTMNLDMLDLLLSRPYYRGQRLTLTPYMGLRGLLLRQKFNISADIASANTLVVLSPPAQSNNQSRGLAIGPHVGADLNWLLGRGFRIDIEGALSVVYMNYTTLKHTESFPPAINVRSMNGEGPTRGYLRAINQLGLGFAWGSYFREKNYHINFAARYDFSIFWNQNVMRQLVAYLGNDNVGYSNPIGNLNLHGLTLTSRLDF